MAPHNGALQVVRACVVGDPGTGKTSLISAAARGSSWAAPSRSPVPVLPPTRLPPDHNSSGVPCVVTDTSSRAEDQQVRGL